MDALTRLDDGVLHARVAAPPVDSAANHALISLISRSLGVSKSKIELRSGHSSREKVLQVQGILQADLDARLSELLGRTDAEAGMDSRKGR